MLTVTEDGDLTTPANSDGTMLQQTRSSEGLGLHIDEKPQQTISAEEQQAIMSFLGSEAAGQVYDAQPEPRGKAAVVGQAGLILVLLVAAGYLLLTYKKMIQRRISSK